MHHDISFMSSLFCHLVCVKLIQRVMKRKTIYKKPFSTKLTSFDLELLLLPHNRLRQIRDRYFFSIFTITDCLPFDCEYRLSNFSNCSLYRLLMYNQTMKALLLISNLTQQLSCLKDHNKLFSSKDFMH